MMHRKHHLATAANYLAAVLCLALLAIAPNVLAADEDDEQPPRIVGNPFAIFDATWSFVRSIDGVNYLQGLVQTGDELVYRNMIVGPLESLVDRRNDPADLVLSSERFALPAKYGGVVISGLFGPRTADSRSKLVDLNGDGEPELSINNALLTLEDPPTVLSEALFGESDDVTFATFYRSFYDADGDGDLDAFVWAEHSPVFFENRGSREVPVFVETSEDWAEIHAEINAELPSGMHEAVGPYSSEQFSFDNIRLADVDGDGDSDILGTESDSDYFENVGSDQAPVFVTPFYPFPTTLGLTADQRDLFAIIDFDSDGDLDMLTHVPNQPTQIAFYEQADGRPLAFARPVILNNFPLDLIDPRKPAGFASRRIFDPSGRPDLNGDGIPELLLALDGSNAPTRSERLLRMELVTLRDGAFEPVEFILESDSVALEDYAAPHGLSADPFFFDEDEDGDLDIVYPRNLKNSILFEQVEPMVFAPARQIAFRSPPVYVPAKKNVDLDDDGDLDLVHPFFGTVRMNLARSPGAISSFSMNSFVGSGSALQICGFVIEGESPQTVILRGLGPSLASNGINNALSNPMLRLYAERKLIASNDDWRDHPEADRIESAGIAPTHVKEAALRVRLSPGAYTMHLGGEPGDSGVGILAIDVDSRMPTDSMQVNMSGRTRISREQDITIGGFIIEGDTPVKVLIRGLGPSLRERGVAAPLPNPRLRLHRGNKLIAVNDDWRLAVNADEIAALPNAPKDDRDAAILRTLAPGSYTVHMRDNFGRTGIGIIAVDRP